MYRTRTGWALAALIAIVLAAGIGYWAGLDRQEKPAASSATHPTAAKAPGKVLYWYDPMKPDVKFDKPGKSPFMDMQLVPKYADEGGEVPGPGISIDSRVTQNLGVRTAVVETSALSRGVNATGTVQADEHRIENVQARATGWLELLHVRAVNDPVRRGQLLAEIYAPDLLAAQEEYLLLAKRASADEQDRTLAEAARQRLLFLGISDSQLAALDRDQRVDPRVKVYAPINGVVAELGVRQGAQVAPGTTLFSLLDLSTVWLVAEVPEQEVGWVRMGRPVEARLQAFPGEVFKGEVDFIYPQMNPETRTVRVRANLRNPGLKLRPGMVAGITISGGATRDVLTVPSEAVIYTGKRTVVIVADGKGKFRAEDVRTGMDSAGRTEVAGGLKPGEEVVTSGQFLIDSEASLNSALSRLEGVPSE